MELPDHPGVRAPYDLALLLLDEGESPATAERLAAGVGGSVVGGIPDLGFHQLRLPTRSLDELDAALATLNADPSVLSAGYDFVMELRDCPATSDVDSLDPPSSCPWQTNQLQLAVTTIEELDVPLSVVKVGLVDSGLAHRNGEFDSVRVIDARAEGGVPDALDDPLMHGTHVAGVMAADDGDGGLNGIASRVLGRRLQLIVAPTTAPLDPLMLASRVMVESQRAIGAGARIINWSLGAGPLTEPLSTRDQTARQILSQLAQNRSNVLFVAAAGNDDYALTGSNDLPAGIAQPNVITVGSHLDCAPTERTPLSSSGARVEIVAQGENIPVIGVTTGSAWTVTDGTSYAAPQVTALAAILASIDPELTAPELKQRILDGAQEGPASTSPRALDLAAPVIQLLLDLAGTDPLLDEDGDGVADRSGAVVGRLCGGPTYTVEGFGTHTYPQEAGDGIVVTGHLLEFGFGLVLQRQGSDSLAMICEGCPFDLATFGVSEEGPVTVAYTRGAPTSGVGGTGVSGSWTLEECTILDRYPSVLSSSDTPMTVLVRSSVSGQMEAGDGSTDEPEVVSFDGEFEVPSIVDPLEPDHGLIQRIESICENGRLR